MARRFVSRIFPIASTLLSSLAVPIPANAAEAVPEGITRVVEGITQSRALIEDYDVSMRWRVELAPNVTLPKDSPPQGVTEGDGEFKWQGKYRFAKSRVHSDHPGEIAGTMEMVGVVNDQYFAYSMKPGVVHQYYCRSLADLPHRVVQYYSMVFEQEPLGLAYDAHGTPFQTLVEGASPGTRWEAREIKIDGLTRIIVGRFLPKVFDGRAVEAEFVFGADQGFQLLKVEGYAADDGHVRIYTYSEPQRLENGSWFPAKVERFTGMEIVTTTISRARINTGISAEDFELDALGLTKPGTVLRRVQLDGKEEAYQYSEGEWRLIPQQDPQSPSKQE